ncbi:effector-associated constant component EACC1 [Kineosporia babensis]|uniref:Uncharacterized protein n=1 Tax=Kineosporia babensis TaxID=499548 RepID=A0A9X1SV16_9ACTN|nr:hypothetical protein [Kineosporia babensis]MCD5313344.1 hypothetical protein [Kineosporia babensis]
MHVHMVVWGEPGEQHVASLESWLQLEPQLRRAPLRRGPEDQLVITLPDDAAPKVLASSLSTWLSTRIGDVRLNVTGPDRTSVEVTVANIADHDELLGQVLRN